ncbi:MAG: AAA family ATPase, partial [Patescibacteria group bacterium]|nr:AAA family ATPase [Patescibacteria group bacterium]
MEIKNSPARNVRTRGETKPIPASPSKSTMTEHAGIATIADGADRFLTEKQQEILEKRGISLELTARMGWRSAGRKGFGEAIEIPFFRDGREVNCKTRTIEGEKRFFQVAGGDKCLYNVDALRDLGDEPLVITEGEMDCMIALQCGYIAVSVPDGAPKDAIGDRDSVKYDYLRDVPQTVKKIIVAADGDAPGAALLHDLSLRLGRHRCLWISYPEGCKDLNDVFLKHGTKGVQETLAAAQFLEIGGLYRLSELPPIPESKSYDVGIPALADHFNLRQGDFSVVTGIPSHGKSTFINFVAYNMAKNHQWGIAFASFEQPPQTEHRRVLRTLAKYHTKDFDAWIDKHFSFIVPQDDSDENIDLPWLFDRMAAAVLRFNANLIIIDPWNEIE